jgi:muconolactone delta-isomerase
MKILAIEKEIAGTTSQDFQPHLKVEAKKVWELQQQNIIREIYFRADRSSAVLILECNNVDEAEKIIQTLPLVQASLIEFEIIPLKPYPGFERLFDKNINNSRNLEICKIG